MSDDKEKAAVAVVKKEEEAQSLPQLNIRMSDGIFYKFKDGITSMFKDAKEEGYTKCTGAVLIAEFEMENGVRGIKLTGACEEDDQHSTAIPGIVNRLIGK